MGLDFFNF